MTEDTGDPRGLRQWIAPAVLLVLGLLLFPSAGRDDKYITYWPAHTLASWGEIVNYNGDRIEQSSSLLHVLLIALATKLSGLDPPVTGWLIGVAFGILGVWLTGRVAERCLPGSGLPAALLLAVASPYAYWSFGGMETPLVACCALGMCLAVARLGERRPSARDLVLLTFPILAYLLVRPESPMVIFCVILGLVALETVRRWLPGPRAEGSDALRWLPAAVLTAALVGLVAVFRLVYFGDVLPQPVAAKSASLTISTLRKGLLYLWHEGALRVLLPVAGLGALKLMLGFVAGRVSSLRVSLALFFVAYSSFIVLTGGGWMEATRFAGHMFPVIAILCVEAIRWLPGPGRQRVLLAAFVMVALLGSIRVAQIDSSSMPSWAILASGRAEDPRYSWIERCNRVNRRDIEMIDAVEVVVSRLAPVDAEPIGILAYNTGMVMYYTALNHYGAFRTIDLHGLSDRWVTDSRHEPTIQRSALGLHWSVTDFFERYAELAEDTGVPRPDVVFVAAWPKDVRGVQWVSDLDFALVYWQLRDFESGTKLLAGRPVRASQILAVRTDRAGPLADLPAVFVPPESR